MENFHSEKYIQTSGGSQTGITMEIEMSFKDGIQRTPIDLESLLKDKTSKSLINRLTGYRFIIASLNQAREAIDWYLKVPESEKPTISAISCWSFAVIQYCKCYQTNEGWTVKLEPSATLKDETQEIKDGHKWFMNERHSFIAHGGNSLSHQARVFVFCRSMAPHQIDGFNVNSLIAAAPSDEAMKNLDRLAEVSTKYSEENLRSVERKIFLLLLQAGHVLHPEITENYELSKK